MKKIIILLFITVLSIASITAQEVLITSSCGPYTTYKVSETREETNCFKPHEFAQPTKIIPNKPTSIIVDVEEKYDEPRKKTIYTHDTTWRNNSAECVECSEPTSQRIIEYRDSKWNISSNSKIVHYTPSCFIQK